MSSLRDFPIHGPLHTCAAVIALLLLTPRLASAQPEVGAPPPSATEYTVVGAYGITGGPDGNVWFTERTPGKIGVISASKPIAEFVLPSSAADPRVITLGPDRALWFTEGIGNKIGRITTDGNISEFPIPTAGASAIGITAGPDGALWFTESARGKIGRITTGGAITEFPLPTADRGPNYIVAGPDGALWFTEFFGNKIGRITTAGDITEFNIPTANAGAFCITVGPDGALWFTEQTANKIGRVTTAGVFTEYVGRTAGAALTGITGGPDGALWFSEAGGKKIGRITTTGTMTEYTVSAASTPYDIAVGPDGAIWFAAGARVGRLELSETRTGVLSHIAAGNGWDTVITLVNNSVASISATVAFRGDDGTPLSLPITTTQQGVPKTTTATSVRLSVSPNTTALVTVGPGLSYTVVGWAEIQSAGPLGGFAIFRSTPPTGPSSEGTVPLQAQTPATMILPYDNTAGFVMGVALANLSSVAATVTARVWDDSGSFLGSETILIPGNGHTAFALPTQIPLTAGKRGIVRFQSSELAGLAGLGLRFSPLNTFTSLPPM